MSLNAPDFRTYQRTVAALWASSPLARGITHPGLEATAKLAEEAGEVAKEINSLGHMWATPEHQAGRQRLEAEIGDALFVISRLANIFRLDLGRAAQTSLEKFAARYAGPGRQQFLKEIPADWIGRLPPRCRCDVTPAQALAAYRIANRHPGDPYPQCPGDLDDCYFMQDRAVVAGGRCDRCGHVKEDAR